MHSTCRLQTLKLVRSLVWEIKKEKAKKTTSFFWRDLFADVMSVHNRNMKHARAIEFDYTNLLAML